MDRIITALPFAATMFVGMLTCLEIGRRLGIRKPAKDPHALSGFSSVDGAVFALYGLLVAFTFSGAPARMQKEIWTEAVAATRMSRTGPTVEFFDGTQAKLHRRVRWRG